MSRPRALVTGASRRVGRAIALELARSGFDVAVHHRASVEEAEATAAACQALGAQAWVIEGDLAEVSEVESIAASVRRRWDGLELLVHNASTFEEGAFAEVTLAQWERMMAVHARAPFLLTQRLLDLLRGARSPAAGAADGDGGLVVAVLDIGAERPLSGYVHYSMSKAALAMLVRCIAVELAPAVRAVGISPGQVMWPDGYGPSLRASISRRIPMGRVGQPEDVARLVRFIALEAPYLNGVTVDVDGGLAVRYG